MKTILFSLLFALPAFADAPPVVPISELSDPTPWLIAKVESAKDPHWYGTAILFRVTQADYLFVTNRHVLPQDLKRFDEIRLRTPLHRYEAEKIWVIAVAPGHDLAVISVPRVKEQEPEGIEKLIARAFVTDDIGGKKLRQGIMGFPGMQEFAAELRPGLKSDPWMPKFYLPDFKDSNNAFHLSPVIPVTKLEVCPPPFLSYCYRSLIGSQGFSGGALEVAAELGSETNDLRIAGIVSHFSPLTSETYVIPMSLALKVANHLVEAGDQMLSDDGLFRYLPDGSIEILATGKKLKKAAPGGTSPGGHDGAGGGGESGPGGHDGAGGGGDSGPGGHDGAGGGGNGNYGGPVMTGPRGNMAMLGEFPKLREAFSRPQTWSSPNDSFRRVLSWMPAFKGITATLDYQPGVILDGKTYQLFADKPIVNLTSFLRDYAKQPSFTPRADFTPRDWPGGMGILADRDMGRRSYGEIRHFRTPKELGNIDGTWTNDSSFSIQSLKPLAEIHSKTPGIDLLVTFSSAQNYSPIRMAQVHREKGIVRIVMLDWVWGMVSVSFPDKLVQQGELTYRFAGELEVETPRRPWNTGGYKGKARGIVLLQETPEDGIWEMKLVFAYEPPIAADLGKTILSPDTIAVEGYYLPLTAIKAKQLPK